MTSRQITCELCGNPGVVKWTISRDSDVGIIDLCRSCEKPLLPFLEKANKGKTDAKRKAEDRARRQRRGKGPSMRFEPLDWTPPEG